MVKNIFRLKDFRVKSEKAQNPPISRLFEQILQRFKLKSAKEKKKGRT
jgi:hypothetical protein